MFVIIILLVRNLNCEYCGIIGVFFIFEGVGSVVLFCVEGNGFVDVVGIVLVFVFNGLFLLLIVVFLVIKVVLSMFVFVLLLLYEGLFMMILFILEVEGMVIFFE